MPMAFCTVPGLEGKVFTPCSSVNTGRKHTCPDCFACQACSEDRCRVCRRNEALEPSVGPPEEKAN